MLRAVSLVHVVPSYNKILTVLDQWSSLILILLAAIIVLPDLGAGSLVDWDEAIYAQVSREMVQSRDWINLHQGYKPYFEKPPLLMWFTAIFYNFFGINEFWARATSAISGILLVWITYLSGKEIYDKRTGFLAGLILIGCYDFILESRQGATNVLLSLFVFTGIFAYIRLRKGSQKWWYLIWACFALAFMVKLWSALVLPAALLINLLLEQKMSEALRSKHFWWGILLAGVIVLPWHLLVYLQNGQELVYAYISRNLLERSFTSMDGHIGTSIYYLDVMRRAFSPWYFLVPFAIALGIKDVVGQERKSNILVVEVFVILALYTFVVSTKIHHYVLPVYPALAILISHLFMEASSSSKSQALIWVITSALFATIIIQDKLLLLCLFVVFGMVFLIKRKLLTAKETPQVIAILIFGVFLLSSTLSYVLGNHRLDISPMYRSRTSPVATIAGLAGRVNPLKAKSLIGFSMQEDWGTDFAVEGPTAFFYSNRPMDIVSTWEQLDELMMNRESGEIIIAEKYFDQLSEGYSVSIIEKVEPLIYAEMSK